MLKNGAATPPPPQHQTLPTEVIGMVGEFSDFRTRSTIRCASSCLRRYLQQKEVGFEEYTELFNYYRSDKCYGIYERAGLGLFQEQVHLKVDPSTLIQDDFDYLANNCLNSELCRVARKVLVSPASYQSIDLLFDDCFLLTAAIRVDDHELFARLLQFPGMDPAADNNSAIGDAAWSGLLEIVQQLLQDPRVDPSVDLNSAIRYASSLGHVDVVRALLQDPRVDPSDNGNYAIQWASLNGHYDVVYALLQDDRVNPSADDNWSLRLATQNDHAKVVQALLQDPRIISLL